MKVRELKNIIRIVSVEGLIHDFTINEDGYIKAIDSSNTLMIELQYNGITIDSKVGIDNGKKTLRLLSSFDDENEITFTDSHIIVKNDNGRIAKIPLVNIESIKKCSTLPEKEPDMVMRDVPLKNLQKAASHKFNELEEEYLFYLEDNMTILRVGNESCGLINEPLGEMSEITNPGQIAFTMNLMETIKSLEYNPNIEFYNIGFIKFEVTTDEYTVLYTLAGRIES